jgi:hypothetical protein
MAVFERRYLKGEYHLLPQWLTLSGLSAQAHVLVKRFIVIVSRAPGHGGLFFDGCPKEGSVGDPVKTVCFRRILRAKAIDDAHCFHAGQSCLLCGPALISPNGMSR